MHSDTKSRVACTISAVVIIAFGLLWRSHLLPLSPFLRKYGGDALWASLVFVLIRFCRPRMSIVSSAVIAFTIAVTVELSQLCHAPWIETIRGFRLGSLILGSTFNWPDIPAYAIGILIVALIDRASRMTRR